MSTFYALYDDMEKSYYSRSGGHSTDVADAKLWHIEDIDKEWLDSLSRTTNDVNRYENANNSDHDRSYGGEPLPENFKVVVLEITMKI